MTTQPDAPKLHCFHETENASPPGTSPAWQEERCCWCAKTRQVAGPSMQASTPPRDPAHGRHLPPIWRPVDPPPAPHATEPCPERNPRK